MKKGIKWLLAIVGLLILGGAAVVAAALFLLDVESLKPKIEQRVSQATGRSFTVGKDLDLSFFPWIGVALSDVRLGNPDGFSEPEFLSMDTFEARLKLLPLLQRQIQVKRFVVKNPRVVLEATRDGKKSWDFGSGGEKGGGGGDGGDPSAGLPVDTLEVETFSVTGGEILWIDGNAGQRKRVSGIELALTDLSFDRPVGIDASLEADGHPATLQGRVGPVGRSPGASPVDFDLTAGLLGEMTVHLKGRAENLLVSPTAALTLDIPAFSPRKAADRIQAGLIPPTTDPNALTRLSLAGGIEAAADRIAVKGGSAVLDDTRIDWSAVVQAFSKPDIQLDMTVDSIDVDRYLPPSGQAAGEGGPSKAGSEPPEPAGSKPPGKAKPGEGDDPLRRLVLDAAIKVGQLKAGGARVSNIDLRIGGKNGVFRIDPMDLALYGGSAGGKAKVDLRREAPAADLVLKVAGVAAGPLMQDLTGRRVIEGTMVVDADIKGAGSSGEAMKRSLDGSGRFLFTDGALVGIDLAEMVRNVQSAFTGRALPTEKPKTDFSELSVPFSLKKGVFSTSESRLQSPLLRLEASGDASLPAETLDFRVTPKLVKTLKGQGDKKERKGVAVPVLVSGTFSEPVFRPDLESIARQQVQERVLESGEIDKVFEKNEELKPLKEPAKGLLKNLFGPKDGN
jgi:AsmA protein